MIVYAFKCTKEPGLFFTESKKIRSLPFLCALMISRRLPVLILALTSISCSYFELEKSNKKLLLQKELQELYKGGITEYPLFEFCTEVTTRSAQKKCFEKELTAHFQDQLSENQFYSSKEHPDTVWIPLVVDQQGLVLLEDYSLPEKSGLKKTILDSVLRVAIETLPTLEPAHIRGVAVSTKFHLPLVISTEE